jgi:hypothetical protein
MMIIAWLGSIAFLFAAGLYLLLVFGLPLGEFAMGGKHKVLPPKLRTACVISIVVQLFGVAVLLQLGNIFSSGIAEGFARGAGYFFAVYLSFNTLLNASSTSKKEKWAITPLSLITAISFWMVTIQSHG